MCNEQKILYARILGMLSMTGVLNENVSSVPDVILFIQYENIIIITYYACTILWSRKPFLWRLLNLYRILYYYNTLI